MTHPYLGQEVLVASTVAWLVYNVSQWLQELFYKTGNIFLGAHFPSSPPSFSALFVFGGSLFKSVGMPVNCLLFITAICIFYAFPIWILLKYCIVLSIWRLCITTMQVLRLLLPPANFKVETATLKETRHATAAGEHFFGSSWIA